MSEKFGETAFVKHQKYWLKGNKIKVIYQSQTGVGVNNICSIFSVRKKKHITVDPMLLRFFDFVKVQLVHTRITTSTKTMANGEQRE